MVKAQFPQNRVVGAVRSLAKKDLLQQQGFDEIILDEKGVLQTRRPDRVMMKDDQVVVVDFKFGKENPKYNKQVKGYMQLLTKMGYKNITGYLWYVDEEKIEKV